MKCINSLLALSIIIIINSCSTMKSNLKTQFTNISSMSGFPSGRLDMNSVFLLVMQVSSATTW